VEAVDIVFWPVALDFKRKDVEAMEDGSIAVCFINGAVRLNEQEEMAKLLRKKAGLVVAFGSCSHMGGIPGLANFYNSEMILNRAYITTPSTDNKDKTMPQVKPEVDGYDLELPSVYDTVYSLDQVIDVDYYLPGCGPPPDLIMNAVLAILEGKLPPKGSVLSPNKSLCETCDRNESKPEELKIAEFKRPYEIMMDPEKCFLEQGIICMGPATRTGCGERCINANMPCRGCFGPTDQVTDQGAKILSAIGSLIASEDEEEIERIVGTIADPAGTFYRFSLPHSRLRRSQI
jgi:F420-non-reducing hydrogenase small subunit